MKFFRTYPPTEYQKTILREYQILHVKWDEAEPLPPPYITCLANTEQNLYFYPRDAVSVLDNQHPGGTVAPKATITGPKNKPVGLSFGKDYLMIKVAFHPTGLYRLLKLPMQKTVNTGLDATHILEDEIKLINSKLKETSGYDEMIEIVSAYITQRMERGIASEEPLDRVAMKMLDPFAKNSLPEWASMACLSVRQFERNFRTRVGISPKLYIRIVRFEYAMRIKNKSPEKTWSTIAEECEYTDSSHLLREFKQFAEFAPGTLTQKQTSGYGGLPTG